VYTREVKGKQIELGVSGMLYKDALVMFDRETGTLWTQVDGSALRGPLAGQRLAEVPAMQTTWKAWKKLHPDTLVLRKPVNIRGTNYADYFADPSRRGLYGTHGDRRLDGKILVIGVHAGNDAMAVPVPALEKKRLVALELAGEPLFIFYARESGTAAVFSAAAKGRRLTFRVEKRGKQVILDDAETHSQWSPLEGRAVAGPLKGTQLKPVAYLKSYWYAWSAYRPNTRLAPTQ